MDAQFLQRVSALQASADLNLKGIKRGFEKENLRVNAEKKIVTTPHPVELGASLTNSRITTDYSEALLEFITPPTDDLEQPITILQEIHQFTYSVLKDEILWAASMPCLLQQENDIPIAEYGISNFGRLKNVYRRGLGHRYGRKMQAIAGLHYNFSLPQDFWLVYQSLLNSKMPLQDFISEQYLGLIRNCLRYGWLLPLLFGASPAVSSSFFSGATNIAVNAGLQAVGEETFIGPSATSLRLSDLGYHNTVQASAMISYNSFPDFLASIEKAIQTEAPEYTKIGVKKNGEYQQLNANILQVEDEHYALIRPKRVAPGAERMLKALQRDGIEYVEVRALDINPFYPLGIDPEDRYFLDAFLLTCLLMDSPTLSPLENKQIASNLGRVAKEGRNLNLSLEYDQGKAKSVQDWALELFAKIEPVARLLDNAYQKPVFSAACQRLKLKIQNPQGLPSAGVLEEIHSHSESYLDFVWRWSLRHRDYFVSQPLLPAQAAIYKHLAEGSLQAQKTLEYEDKISFDEYLQQFLEL